MSNVKTYTVHVGDEIFELSESQILMDAPSFFSAAFLDGYQESKTLTLHIDGKSPELFRLIYDYLAGYSILPLSLNAIPRKWSLEATLQNLTKDALFYGLDGLVELLQPAKEEPKVEQRPAKRMHLLPPLDFTRGAWAGSTPNLCGIQALGEALPEPLSYGASGVVLARTAAHQYPTAVVFSATDVHVSLLLEPRQGTIRARWTFLRDEEAIALQSQLPQPFDPNTGCAAGSITRQVLLETATRQFNFDSLLLWAAAKVPQGYTPTAAIAEDNQALDTLFCVSTPLAAPEEGVRAAMICKRIIFAVFSGTDGPYAAPLFISAQPLSSFWSALR